MANWYVRTGGSDSADGTTPATAFATVGKAMTQAGLAAGDYIYVGGGHYRIAAAIAPTSMASMTYLVGDIDGSQTGDPGEVVLSNYNSGDSAAPAGCAIFQLTSKNFWTFRRLSLISGANYGWNIDTSTHDITIQDCSCVAHWPCVYASALTFGQVLNFTIERNRFFTASDGCLRFDVPSSGSGAHVNANVVARNNVLIGRNGFYVYTGAVANTYRTGGFSCLNNFIIGGAYGGVTHIGSAGSTTYPIYAYNNFIMATGDTYGAIYSAAAGVVVEDYNIIRAFVARTNVTAGTHSYAAGERNWRFSMGHEALFGGITRPFTEWSPGSPLFNFGGTSVPSDDINGMTRPASGTGQSSTAQSLGPYERTNGWAKETLIVRTGTTALHCAGPGYQDFELHVDPVSTTVGIYMRFDAAYAGTKPSMSVLNGGECGVADATATMAGGADTWEQLTLNFTPTKRGIVTIRLLSSSTAAAGDAYADDFSVS